MTSSFTTVLPKHLHLVGIGGDGMQSLAHALLDKGHSITGSDMSDTPPLESLRRKGAQISVGADSNAIKCAEALVISNAISTNHPELVEARLRDIPIYLRAQALSFLGDEKEAIYIAGTHGKSTTTAMLVQILHQHQQNCSYVMGGTARSQNLPKGKWVGDTLFVAEACEAFANLEFLNPTYALVTNIDDDHLEHYGNQEKLDHSFVRFLNKSLRSAIACGDDEGIARIITKLKHKPLTYGFGAKNDFLITNYFPTSNGSCFRLHFQNQILNLVLQIPGQHNALNAAGAAALALSLKVPSELIIQSLSQFLGIEQRWQDYGLINGVRIIDDFAHHPSALAALVKTARDQAGPAARLVLAYQPQLYSRTKRLQKRILEQLSHCDQVLLLEIDPQGESSTDNGATISSQDLVSQLRRRNVPASYFATHDHFLSSASQYFKPDDYVVVAGGANMRNVAHQLKQQLDAAPTQSTTNFIPPRKISFWKPFNLWRWELKKLQEILLHRTPSPLILFERFAQYDGKRIALDNQGDTLTYAQLNLAAASLAAHLKSVGIQAGQAVGVRLYSGNELILTILALAKLRAIYLPIDTHLPVKRVQMILDQAQASHLICNDHTRLPSNVISATQWVISSNDFLNKSPESLRQPLFSNKTYAHLYSSAHLSNELAYICFTSGSTGIPKGVPIAWEGLNAVINALAARLEFSDCTRTLINTAIGFDVSIGEIWLGLGGGAQLVLTNSRETLTGNKLARLIQSANITHLTITPALLLAVPQLNFDRLQTILCAGEACPQNLVNRWAGDYAFFNAYGPTEASIYATIARCTPHHPVTIGKAFKHVQAFILTSEKTPTPIHQIGELYLGGIGISPGYIAENKRATEAFITYQDPESGQVQRVYRTGDLASKNDEGDIFYHGREDRQIKLNGVRIELGEIEYWLNSLNEVKSSAAILNQTSSNQEVLGFIVTQAEYSFNESALIGQLSHLLPPSFVPKRLLPLDDLPLNLSGKIDYVLLKKYAQQANVTRPFFAPPRSETEERLVNIWKEILQCDEIGVYDDFYSLGGDSLKGLGLIDEIEQKFAITVPPGFMGTLTHITNQALQVETLLGAHLTNTAEGFYATRIYSQQKHLTAKWQGDRKDARSLLVSLGSSSAPFDVIACVQYEEELINLHQVMGSQYRILGLRSGHLVMTYSPENVEALCNHYLSEIMPYLSGKPFTLIGVCQGGTLALNLAKKLTAINNKPKLLTLIEQARLPLYDQALAFFYSSESYLNPHIRFNQDLSRYQEIYGDRFTLDIIDGEHGSILRGEPAIQFAYQLKTRLSHLPICHEDGANTALCQNG